MSRGYFAVGLNTVKTPENVGHALRGCGVFGAAFLAFSGHRYRPHPTDTQRAVRHLPLMHFEDLHEAIPYDCVPVAVELTPFAVGLPTYTHPERAFYVFGAEDQTLGQQTLSWCRDVVYIPSARCLNLAACVNVVLYDRCAKRCEWPERLPLPMRERVA